MTTDLDGTPLDGMLHAPPKVAHVLLVMGTLQSYLTLKLGVLTGGGHVPGARCANWWGWAPDREDDCPGGDLGQH